MHLINAQTGEILVAVKARSMNKPRYPSTFMTLFDSTVARLWRSGLSGTEFRVWFWILSQMRHDVFSQCSQAEIALDLGCSQASVSRSLRALVGAELIERRDLAGSIYLRIDADSSWRGSVGQWYGNRKARLQEQAGEDAGKRFPGRKTMRRGRPVERGQRRKLVPIDPTDPKSAAYRPVGRARTGSGPGDVRAARLRVKGGVAQQADLQFLAQDRIEKRRGKAQLAADFARLKGGVKP